MRKLHKKQEGVLVRLPYRMCSYPQNPLRDTYSITLGISTQRGIQKLINLKLFSFFYVVVQLRANENRTRQQVKIIVFSFQTKIRVKSTVKGIRMYYVFKF